MIVCVGQYSALTVNPNKCFHLRWLGLCSDSRWAEPKWQFIDIKKRLDDTYYIKHENCSAGTYIHYAVWASLWLYAYMSHLISVSVFFPLITPSDLSLVLRLNITMTSELWESFSIFPRHHLFAINHVWSSASTILWESCRRGSFSCAAHQLVYIN